MKKRVETKKKAKRTNMPRMLVTIPAIVVITVSIFYIKANFNEYKANASVNKANAASDKYAAIDTPIPTLTPTTITPVPLTPTPTKSTSPENKEEKIDTNFNVEVDEKLLKGTVFVGDSITQGISDYGFLDKKYVLAQRGLMIEDAPKLLASITKLKPRKVYIMIGTDDLLGRMNGEKFAEKYGSFVKSIKKKLPDSEIYVQSILPVALKAEQKNPLLNPSRIDEFNRAIIEMAKKEQANYIDVAAKFKNKQGYLPNELSTDGIHLKFKCYKVWLNFLKEGNLK